VQELLRKRTHFDKLRRWRSLRPPLLDTLGGGLKAYCGDFRATGLPAHFRAMTVSKCPMPPGDSISRLQEALSNLAQHAEPAGLSHIE
jgi:hypothetical protein